MKCSRISCNAFVTVLTTFTVPSCAVSGSTRRDDFERIWILLETMFSRSLAGRNRGQGTEANAMHDLSQMGVRQGFVSPSSRGCFRYATVIKAFDDILEEHKWPQARLPFPNNASSASS